jgi:hypothetical protein
MSPSKKKNTTVVRCAVIRDGDEVLLVGSTHYNPQVPEATGGRGRKLLRTLRALAPRVPVSERKEPDDCKIKDAGGVVDVSLPAGSFKAGPPTAAGVPTKRGAVHDGVDSFEKGAGSGANTKTETEPQTPAGAVRRAVLEDMEKEGN